MSMLLVQKLYPEAIIPTVAHPGKDLGFDLYALEDTVLQSQIVKCVRTGVAVAMEGFGFRIADRSSMALKGVRVSGGVIDEGYTGEMIVNLFFAGFSAEGIHSPELRIYRGDRIAQFIPQRVETGCAVVSVNGLPESKRGNNGYGSTGR